MSSDNCYLITVVLILTSMFLYSDILHTNNNESSIPNHNSNVPQIETYNTEIDDYVTNNLPRPSMSRYVKPYNVAAFLYHHKDRKMGEVKVSKLKLMKIIIEKKLVPCKVTSLYHLIRRFQDNNLPVSMTWTNLETHGRKPYLSASGIDELVDRVKNDTDGGSALSNVEIRDMVKEKIRLEWRNSGKTGKPPTVKTQTLDSYVSMIKSQRVFNVHNNVLNKTQTRAIAEWSFRSSIAYCIAVLCTHYLPDVDPSPYHPKRKDLSKEALNTLLMVEKQFNRIIGNPSKSVTLIPILPNLITSTDEVTIFASSSPIHNKDSFYVVSKPSYSKNEVCSSASRNNYRRTITGDAHCRGLRIVINCTFTAGGLSAPLFVVVYGMSMEEMPFDDIVILEVPGLTVGSDVDVYSTGKGFLTFVRGKSDNEEDDQHTEGTPQQPNDIDENGTSVPSKEAKIASLYRKLVYHPFIKHIRMTKYGWNPELEPEVPDSLQAASWMDGANGQIKEITKEEQLKEEHQLKITCMKHSAARTVVEQAADAGPMFKGMKCSVKQGEQPNSCTSPIYQYLEQSFIELSDTSTDPCKTNIVILPNHKKNALMLTLAKLPGATGKAFTTSNVRKGFVLNGQVDTESKLAPDVVNLLHTYRGDINGTCLENASWLCEKFFEEMYNTGVISESSFDAVSIPMDRDLNGATVEKCFGVSQENRQRAKILSSEMQILERRKLIHSKRLDLYKKQKSLYDTESKEYQLNKKCEAKILEIMAEIKTRDENISCADSHTMNFVDMTKGITYNIVMEKKKSILCNEAKAFLKVRSNVNLVRGRLAYQNIPKRKDDILRKLVSVIDQPVRERFFATEPVEPVLDDNMEGSEVLDDGIEEGEFL